jgi:hypothetical protein
MNRLIWSVRCVAIYSTTVVESHLLKMICYQSHGFDCQYGIFPTAIEVWGTPSSEYKEIRVLGFENFQPVINVPTFRVITLLEWSQHVPPKHQYISTRLYNTSHHIQWQFSQPVLYNPQISRCTSKITMIIILSNVGGVDNWEPLTTDRINIRQWQCVSVDGRSDSYYKGRQTIL